jgi:hypothetical protein
MMMCLCFRASFDEAYPESPVPYLILMLAYVNAGIIRGGGYGWEQGVPKEVLNKINDLTNVMVAHNTLTEVGPSQTQNLKSLAPSKVARQQAQQAMAAINVKARALLDLGPDDRIAKHFCNNGNPSKDWASWRPSLQAREPSVSDKPACPCGGSCGALRELLQFPDDLPLVNYASKEHSPTVHFSEKLVNFAKSALGFQPTGNG